jgi:hypothetical protein
MKIWFDMDGTIADLYAVENWLPMLRAYDPKPYLMAKPMHHMATLARMLNKAQAQGHELCIISWCSKESTADYDALVAQAKRAWLAKHLPSVHWDIVKIVPYGQNKWETCKSGILFDDEERNRMAWEAGKAFTPETIFTTLATLTR